MKISEVENLIIKNSSKFSFTKGRELLREKKLLKIDVRKIDNIYNIYGTLKNEKNTSIYSPHLKLDLTKEKITFAKCGCEMFSEVSNNREVYLCEHLVAMGLDFVNKIKSKLNKKDESNSLKKYEKNIISSLEKLEKDNDKEILNINVSLKEDVSNKEVFTMNLFVGIKSMHLIADMGEFVNAVINNKEYHIGKGLLFNPSKYDFSKEDKELLEYIYEYSITHDNVKNSNFICVNKEVLRRLLFKIKDKKIKFLYGYQTYICEIKNEILPISFTFKYDKDNYTLITKKDFPISLNDREDVFFFQRTLYIPPDFKNDIYKIFSKELKKSGRINFSNNISSKSLFTIVKYINSISNDVNVDKYIVSKLNCFIEFEFNFARKDDKYECLVYLKYDNKVMSYEEALQINDHIIQDSKKLDIIEREFNKSRFFYRDGRFIFSGTEEEYYNFLKTGIEEFKKISKINIDKESENYFKLSDNFNADIYFEKNDDDTFKIGFNMNENELKDLNTIMDGYKERKSYVVLEDKRFVDINNPKVEEFVRIIENLNININENSHILDFNKIYYLEDRILNNENINVDGKDILKIAYDKIKDLEELKFDVPKDLKCNLREYQISGYRWFKNMSYLKLGGILADEMGLGKTVQTIAFLLSEKDKRSMIIVPTSLVYNWKSEFEKFAPHLKLGVIHGNANVRKQILENYKDYNVIITTYGTLRNDYDMYEEKFFDYLILDEGQNINNPKAAITSLVKKLKAGSKFILTGTPIENNLTELWSLFDFIMPGYLYSQEEFTSKFIKSKDDVVNELKVLINPYILRRTKNDVELQLPDKEEKNVYVDMTPMQEELYKAYVSDIKEKIKEDSLESNVTLFSYLTKLRQICLDPSILIEDYDGGSGKFDMGLTLILDKIKEHKILLFSQFTSVLKKLRKELEDRNIKYSYLDGSTPAKSRINIVDEFNESEEMRVFLISLKAGGTGLNLTSADVVIHFDPWWNPSIHEQASDRAHRIGQKHNVEVIKLIAKNSIEEKVVLMQENKKNLINDVITGELKEDNFIYKLSKSELIEIL